MSDGDPVSWRGLVYGTPVVASDGTRVGSVREVLGSDAEDIFHGLRVRLEGPADASRDVMIPADAIEALGTADVRVARSASEIRGLPAYDEEATYHLASVGWLRRHLGWTKDSASDEEAG
jgi:sporulation protein YlmC with PRC-barrel domain